MGQGYTRNDTADNIADGKVIDAADLDGEFNAIEDAFAAATGHTHDGTAAEGGPVTVLGPAQEYIGGASDFTPKTTNTYDLGSASLQWKDLYVDGVAYLDSVDIDAGAIDGATIGANSAAAGTFTDLTATGTVTIDLSGISSTGDLAIADGGTGAGTASGARTNLGLVIGTDVQAYDAGLADIAGLAVTDGNFIVGDGANWVAESGATARASLGLGSIATQASSSVSITGGSISGITDLAVADGGTGASTASGARTNLGLVIGTDVQAYDAGLASIAGLTTAADRMIYTTASDTYAVATLTSAGRALLDDADASAQRTTLGLAIGTDVQAYDAELAALAGLTSAANKVPYFTGSGTADLLDFVDEDNMASDSATAVPSQQSVKAYVDSNSGTTLLGTITTSSGTSQSLTSLTLTNYKTLRLVFAGVSVGSNSQTITVEGVAVVTSTDASTFYRGNVDIDLATGAGSSVVGSDALGADFGLSTASTSVTVACTSTSFDGGSVRVYGIA